ncbi:putative peptide zinc metalloprotease protein [Hamadaea flava]|uniref:Metalloprotease n=1 Tax=Hamadaea flava TaxID=1742688 RepID=A0ABV8LMV1_9ACTN|nr:peptidase M50 [Hamadaea flava]MCP2329553.1 putative peptide zinc metalloprotease protein [Hamadaea flava]
MTATELPKTQQPRVRPDLLISRELGRGPDRIHLLKAPGGATFEVSPKERFVISRLNGLLSMAEIGDQYAARFARRLGPAQWSQLLWALGQRELLDTGGPPVAPIRQRPALRRLAEVSRWIFTGPTGVVLAAGLLAMYACLAPAVPRLWRDATGAFGDWRSMLMMGALTYLSAMLHELAHAVAATRFGCAAVRINLVALSCKVEDYPFLPSRVQQVVVAAAGGVLNSVLVVPFAVAWPLLPPGSAGRSFAAAAVLCGAVQSLVNFVPVAPLDGYKMLSHLLGLVSLGPESRRYLWSRPRKWLTGRGLPYPRSARIALGLYGLAWHTATAAAATLVVYAAGSLLAPFLGPAGYAGSAAVVVLTLTLWLTARPPRPVRAGSTQQPVM